MGSLELFRYQMTCTKRALNYFPSGVREGLLIMWRHEDGRVSLGEFAPLVGIHDHTLSDLIDARAEMASALEEMWSVRDENLVNFFAELSFPISNVLSMMHFLDGKTNANGAILLTALIEATTRDEAMWSAQNYIAQGYTCLKIKVGNTDVTDDIKKVKTIRALGGKSLRLRLDANKKFNFCDASALLQGLKNVDIEYIEEPLADMSYARELFLQHGVPIAVDESFAEPFSEHDLINIGAQIFVVKPSRFHSVYQAMALAEKAREAGMNFVMSHCFESDLSSMAFALMIDRLGINDYAHGIVADGFFRESIFATPLRSFRGQLLLASICAEISENHISRRSLERIA